MVCREMRDWRGAGDSRSCDDAVRRECSTQWMLYSLSAVLGVCCTRCLLYSVSAVLGVNSSSWHGGIERDDLTSCSCVMVELRTRMREMRGYGGNHHEKLGLRECHVQVNVPCPIQQVWVPIRRVITPIQGLPNPIRLVVPLISHIRL